MESVPRFDGDETVDLAALSLNKTSAGRNPAPSHLSFSSLRTLFPLSSPPAFPSSFRLSMTSTTGLGVDHAHFLSAWIEAVLYGLNMVLFFTCFWVLYSRPINGNRSAVMLTAMTLMFALNTVHVGATLRATEEAFFEAQNATAYFANRRQPLNLLIKSIYGLVLLIGDGLLIYRCWIIWAKNWWMISGPMFLLAGTAGTGWYLVYDFSMLRPGASLFAGQAKIMAPVTFILSLLCNVVTTCLMIWRIVSVSRMSNRSGQSGSAAYRRTLAVIVESGALVPVILIITLGFFLSGMNEEALFTGPMSQVIGIVPTLTVLQVRLGYSQFDRAEGRGGGNADPERTVVGTTTALTHKSANSRGRGHSMAHSRELSSVPLHTMTSPQPTPGATKSKFDFDDEQEIEMKPTATLTYGHLRHSSSPGVSPPGYGTDQHIIARPPYASRRISFPYEMKRTGSNGSETLTVHEEVEIPAEYMMMDADHSPRAAVEMEMLRPESDLGMSTSRNHSRAAGDMPAASSESLVIDSHLR